MKNIFLFLLFLLAVLNLDANGFVPKSFQAEFVQVVEKRISGKTNKRSGTINYLKPKYLRLELEGKKKGKVSTIVVSNGKKLWHYSAPFNPKEKGQLNIDSTSKNPFISLFNSLENGLKTNKKYKVKSSENKYLITFSNAEAKKLNIDQLVITFKDNKKLNFESISSIEVHDSKKKKKMYVFNKIEVTPNQSLEVFKFQTPPNTNIKEN